MIKTIFDKFRKPILIIGVLVLFVVSSQFQKGLNQNRDDMGLTDLAPLENAPPMLAFTTVALGGFRGLIANALWMRATDLQENDKYFEMVQLSDWITKLQPKITTVWYHLAWNMAYNISVKFRSPEERWMWVQRGIELLRDEGLVYNPTDTLLYRELSWFFQHKMGANLDDAHYHYKASWKALMEEVLGTTRDGYRDLIDPQDEAARQRAEVLKTKYKMNPATMAEVDDKHGPFDWRLPEAHAVYWAYLGWRDAVAEEKMTVRRSIYQSMQMSFQRGKLIENPFTQTYELAPNLDIIPKVDAAYVQMMEEEPEQRDHIDGAHRNFLKKAVYFMYLGARRTEAEELLARLMELYPQAVNPTLSLDEYAVEQAQEDVGETSSVDTTAMIQGFLFHHFAYLAVGEDERATGYYNLARSTYKRYSYETRKSTQRVRLRSFDAFRTDVINNLINPANEYPEDMVAQLKSLLGLSEETSEVSFIDEEENSDQDETGTK